MTPSSSGSATAATAAPPPTPAVNAGGDEDGARRRAEDERLQGERFLQLSQRCHEQNWAQVHALAEQIEVHRQLMRTPPPPPPPATPSTAVPDGGPTTGSTTADGAGSGGGRGPAADGDPPAGGDDAGEMDENGVGPSPAHPNRIARDGTVSVSGEVMLVDCTEGAAAEAGENRRATTTTTTTTATAVPPPPPPAAAPVPTPSAARPPGTLRMLSTCLGTASPLAWTCRYSAPSATVKLVLDLDAPAVRRCLPQLGTPLHECVGRPRPLRRMPLKGGGRWNGLIGNESCSTPLPSSSPASMSSPVLAAAAKKKKKKKNRRRKRKHKVPRILAGLREWRRAVRTLIQTDAALAREDARRASALLLQRSAAGEGDGGDENGKNGEEWRGAVRSMIRDNVSNIQRFKDPGGSSGPAPPRAPARRERQRRAGPPVRATLAQDADGNTPLHFMVRGAASPAFGGGRWQARHGMDDDEYDDDGDDDDDDDDEQGGKDGGDAMDVDKNEKEGSTASSDGGASSGNDASGSLRRIEYWGMSGSNWDGVRWCMEAHLRRVERRRERAAEQRDGLRRKDVEMREERNEEEEEDEDDDVCASESDGERGVARRALASVRIGSPSCAEEEMGDAEEGVGDGKPKASKTPKLPSKRKSLDFGDVSGSVKRSASKDEGVRSLFRNDHPPSGSSPRAEPSGEAGGGDVHARVGLASHSRKDNYLDADERQDCAYDPLLGAVRDLVRSCPEASGVPDHREYEETPLIVALKSSIYVVLEPENEFQLVEARMAENANNNVGGAGGAAGGGGPVVAQQPPVGVPAGGVGGDFLPIFGQAFLNAGGNAGNGDIGGGGGLGGGIGGFGGGFGGAFPFPELGALMANRPFNVFPDDEAMMAVLRGHGRRANRDPSASRRRRSAAALRASAAPAPVLSPGPPAIPGGGTGWKTDQAGGDPGEDDSSACSSVSDDSSLDGEDDPRRDAFVPSANERIFSFVEPPGAQLGLMPRRRPRYDYQTALEYRIFCLVRIMLDAYPRAACLMISDYTPLHSAVFHGRCPDTIRLLLDAEARFGNGPANDEEGRPPAPVSAPQRPSDGAALPGGPCPTLSGPAMLCTNTRGELPLHFACMRNECARSVRLLAGADPRAALVRDASGRTPLRWLWIRFVDGLLDRFGGRDTRRGDEDDVGLGLDQAPAVAAEADSLGGLAFREQEGGGARNFPNSAQSALGGGGGILWQLGGGGVMSVNEALGDGGRSVRYDSADGGIELSPEKSMFVFDTEYLRRTRNIDRTVDFLRMRHVPSGFESIEYVAAEHAITVLLKLRYLQQRRNRQLEAAMQGSAARGGDSLNVPPDVPMSTKEEFILYALEKFTALIYAALVASRAEERSAAADAVQEEAQSQSSVNEEGGEAEYASLPPRKRLWHSLPQASPGEGDPDDKFFLVHEACGSSRASCPAAVAKICIRLFSDQLYQRDHDGRLPLHRAALRGLGWEPPGSDIDTSHASLADETLTLLREVLGGSHESAPEAYDDQGQLPLHCAIDSLVTSLVMGKRRRASLHAEARAALQRHRRAHVEIAMECLAELLCANSMALQRRDGRSRLFPFMQAALPHIDDCAVVKYTSDLSRRPGFDVGVGYHSMEQEVVEESDVEGEADHVTIIYYLLREDPSVINGLGT